MIHSLSVAPLKGPFKAVAYPGIFCGGGGVGQHIPLRTEGKENGDLGAVAPSQGFHSIYK
jgi:hypothetical protein